MLLSQHSTTSFCIEQHSNAFEITYIFPSSLPYLSDCFHTEVLPWAVSWMPSLLEGSSVRCCAHLEHDSWARAKTKQNPFAPAQRGESLWTLFLQPIQEGKELNSASSSFMPITGFPPPLSLILLGPISHPSSILKWCNGDIATPLLSLITNSCSRCHYPLLLGKIWVGSNGLSDNLGEEGNYSAACQYFFL